MYPKIPPIKFKITSSTSKQPLNENNWIDSINTSMHMVKMKNMLSKVRKQLRVYLWQDTSAAKCNFFMK